MYKNIPILDNYTGILSDSYWEHWTKRTYQSLMPVKSCICQVEIEKTAKSLGYTGNEERLKRIIRRLRIGADIGCKGTGRLPTLQKNSRSTLAYGDRVADSLQGWIVDGLCFGPLREDELPWIDYSCNPITVKLKPNGKARVCINMSAPYPKDSDNENTPASVNSGIDSEQLSTSMSSTKSFCKSLMRAGCQAQMCKLD